ncbi:MAG: MEDS domain-containing protein [Acidimicrobiales bacterium]
MALPRDQGPDPEEVGRQLKVTGALADLAGAGPGSHVCWVPSTGDQHVEAAAALLEGAKRYGQMPVLLGPGGSAALSHLAPLATVASDPAAALAASGRWDGGEVLQLLQHWSAKAGADGFEGLCVVADMDWLVPLAPSGEEIVAFEVLLDRFVAEMGAAAVCAYKASSFDEGTVAGALAVHPRRVAEGIAPAFEFVSAGSGGWRLSGELDATGQPLFSAALRAALTLGPCFVDVANVEFMDIATMRAIAHAARSASVPVELRGASPTMCRHWRLGGFGETASLVELSLPARAQVGGGPAQAQAGSPAEARPIG